MAQTPRAASRAGPARRTGEAAVFGLVLESAAAGTSRHAGADEGAAVADI